MTGVRELAQANQILAFARARSYENWRRPQLVSTAFGDWSTVSRQRRGLVFVYAASGFSRMTR